MSRIERRTMRTIKGFAKYVNQKHNTNTSKVRSSAKATLDKDIQNMKLNDEYRAKVVIDMFRGIINNYFVYACCRHKLYACTEIEQIVIQHCSSIIIII